MNISSAIFDRSAPDLDSCPDESLPEFAFIGRSNVGKSSLLNMLAGKTGLARTSPRPGFTKLINMFTMNGTWRLVDLPGYGYARVAQADSSKFNLAVQNYLQHRPNLRRIFALIDARLEPQALDLEFVEWLARHHLPFVLVFTKSDKLSSAAVQANIAAFTARIAGSFVQPPACFSCSAVTQQGRQELLGVIDQTMKELRLEASPVTESPDDAPTIQVPKAKRPSLRKKAPNPGRIW